ncbi:hypothetical protein J2Y69_002016 [Microbacterium resistens]|uniref:Secreted protein n=1 Tax=Microbacterium resistens TaxID=156977 RepID=A0ABU1SEP8_9MICO|nr:hypothetical protein [Microbacterium resistens]MDR6867413.1 hypothetical protein [Microbacterium resistens]
MKKKIGYFGGIVGVALLAASTAIPAYADTNDQAFSESVVDSLVSFWGAGGVSASDQSILVANIQNGIVPLSLQRGSEPVDTATERVGLFERTTETFADGSIRIADLQVEPGVVADPTDITSTEAAPTSADDVTIMTDITACSVSSGSGYSNADNCLVRGGGGLVTNFFYASYTLVQGANNDQLRNTKNPGQTCIYPYSCTTPSRSQFVGQETTWTNAGATYTGTASTPLSSQTTYLSIEVGEDHATPIWTMP